MKKSKESNSSKTPSNAQKPRKATTKPASKKSPKKKKSTPSKCQGLIGVIERAAITLQNNKAVLVLILAVNGKRAIYQGFASAKSIAALLEFIGITDFAEIGMDKVKIDFDGVNVLKLHDRKGTCSFTHEKVK